MYERVKVNILALLTSALEASDLPDSRTGRFIPEEITLAPTGYEGG